MDLPRVDLENLPLGKTLAIVLVIFIAALFVDHGTFVKWGGLLVGTIALFWYFLDQSRQFLKRGGFWLLTGILLALHLSGCVILLILVSKWKLIWYMGMLIELAVFFYLRDRVLDGD